MSTPPPQDLIDALDEQLELERDALKNGQLEKLEAILAKKEELIDELNAQNDLGHETLNDVHEKVSRNQDLLKSAMLGIKAVSARMQELRKVRQGLEVYDPRGQRARYATNGATKLEKRA